MSKGSHVSFRVFTQEEQAKETKAILEKNDIKCALKIYPPSFNAALGTMNDFEAELFVNKTDYNKVKEILEQQAKQEIVEVDKDHHLRELSDTELYEIIYFKEEWNELDVQIAYNLLDERGVEDFEKLKDQLFEENSDKYKPAVKGKTQWLVAAYISLLIFPFIGICLGIYIYSRKTKLPDETIVYHFIKRDRYHGLFIATVSIALFILGVFSESIFFWKSFF